MVVKL